MDASSLLPFKLRCSSDFPHSHLVASLLRFGHVAYLAKNDLDANGFYWTPPDPAALMRSISLTPLPGMEILRDERSPSPLILTELGKAKTFPASSLTCGVFLRPKVYLQTWPRGPNQVFSPIFHLNERRKEANIKFSHSKSDIFSLRKLVFKFKDLRDGLIHLQKSSQRVVLYIPLMRSPKTMDAQSSKKQKYWICGGDKDPWVLSTGVMYEDKDVMWEFLANLTVIRMEFDLNFPVNRDLEAVLGRLQVVSPLSHYIKTEHVSNILPSLTLSDLLSSNLPFPVQYLLFCLLSHGYTSIFHINPMFLGRVKLLRSDYVERAFTAIYKSCRTFYARPEGFEERFEEEYGKAEQGSVVDEEERKDVGENSHLLRRLLVTPSTVYFTLPSRELSNRVTRHYIDHIDRFLRISFVDERLSSLSSPSIPIRSRISDSFLPYFRFFDRTYELLSFSSSQLRSGSLWMWANLPDLTSGHIRAWLGDLHHIKNPAKYSARVGLCFSNSKHTIEIEDAWMRHIPEIESESDLRPI